MSENESSITSQETGNADLDQIIEIAGYSYDPKQDIFFSEKDPWQRNMGYCRLFDEAAAPLGMIIDTEPIIFNYQRKKWMIGFWKGQYDMVTGGEVGVYKSAIDLNLPGIFQGTFYKAISDKECLPMSITLKKNGNVLFTRKARHWWLTGFKLGEFSEPSELTMDIVITFPNPEMRDAFVAGLKKTGYPVNRFTVNENNVQFTFAEPFSPQPITRNPTTDRIIQQKNKLLCDLYQEVTGKYATVPEKVKAIEKFAPELYEKFLGLGKNKHTFELFVMVVMLGTLILAHFLKNTANDESENDDLPNDDTRGQSQDPKVEDSNPAVPDLTPSYPSPNPYYPNPFSNFDPTPYTTTSPYTGLSSYTGRTPYTDSSPYTNPNSVIAPGTNQSPSINTNNTNLTPTRNPNNTNPGPFTDRNFITNPDPPTNLHSSTNPAPQTDPNQNQGPDPHPSPSPNPLPSTNTSPYPNNSPYPYTYPYPKIRIW